MTNPHPDAHSPITMQAQARAMIGLRVALIALGGVLGLVLLSQGFVLIGALLLSMAGVRALLVVRWRNRVDQRVARGRAFRTRLDDRHHP